MNVYIGMDVHKKDWKVTILTDQLSHKTFSQPPNPQVLVNYLHRNFPDSIYHSAYEAGFCGFWIHRQLKAQGINSMVVNAADIPTTQKEKLQKEDKRDSRKIARGLRNGELSPIYVPDVQRVEDRSLVRMRHLLVKDMRRYKQRIKSFLYFHGIIIPAEYERASEYWSKPFMNWLHNIKMNHLSGQQSLKMLLRETESLRQSLLEITKSVRDLSAAPEYANQNTLLRSIPGIGLVTAMTLLTELDNIDRFDTNDKLRSFIGIVPTTRSSGEKEKHGEMTMRGNHLLRKMIIESSWVAARIDPTLTKAYHAYCARMEPNKAIIRIARKMVGRIHFVLKNQKPYKLLEK